MIFYLATFEYFRFAPNRRICNNYYLETNGIATMTTATITSKHLSTLTWKFSIIEDTKPIDEKAIDTSRRVMIVVCSLLMAFLTMLSMFRFF